MIRDLPKIISSATSKHVAAFFYGDSNNSAVSGTSPTFIENQGTMTFIDYRGYCLGITNEHVIRDSGLRRFYLAFTQHEPIASTLLFKSKENNPDFPFDIAVFLMNRERIIRGGKTPINIDLGHKAIMKNKQGLAVGFPGRERFDIKGIQMAHPLYHVVANCESISDRKINLRDINTIQKNKSLELGGLSGGAIFGIESEDKYFFTGIISDAKMNTSGNEIWIMGFPLSLKQIDLAFKVFRVQKRFL